MKKDKLKIFVITRKANWCDEDVTSFDEINI